MRPIATEQNPLRNPLNHLLATEAQVRLLRVLCAANGPLSVAAAADRAELTRAGARKALQRVLNTGFVVRVGVGRDQQFELRSEDPLTQAIEDLFKAEQSRYEELLRSLRRAFEESSSPPRSAWISELPRELGEPLEISVLHDARRLRAFSQEMRELISAVEAEFDLTIELVGYTRADLPALEGEDLTLVAGLSPVPIPGKEPPTESLSHQDLDRSSLDRAQGLAELVDRDPSLIERARRYLDRELEEGHGAADADLREWRQILEDYPITRLLRFLTSSSARANRLRQSSPFYPVLISSEREKLQERDGSAV